MTHLKKSKQGVVTQEEEVPEQDAEYEQPEEPSKKLLHCFSPPDDDQS